MRAFVGKDSNGKIADDLYKEKPEFGESVQLYRTGFLSAYDVPWPAGNARDLEKNMEVFLKSNLMVDGGMSIVVSHKFVITCLAMILLKKYKNFTENHYGYIDIPVGAGVIFEINDDVFTITLLNYDGIENTMKTNVVIKDGIIAFPESVCAACWKDNALLLVNQARPNKKTWELPGGKIEAFESPIAAAMRELQEESGIKAENGELLYSLDLDLSISFHRTHLLA